MSSGQKSPYPHGMRNDQKFCWFYALKSSYRLLNLLLFQLGFLLINGEKSVKQYLFLYEFYHLFQVTPAFL